MQFGGPSRILGQLPGLARVDVLVDTVGIGHDFADCLAVVAAVEERRNRVDAGPSACETGMGLGIDRAEPGVEALDDESGAAACDVDQFADEVGIDPGDEIIRIEVDVFDPAVQLGGDVIAQPFGIHAELEIAQRRDAGAATLAHLFAADGDESVHVDPIGRLAPGEVQHRRPEQHVEIDDVLADEVHLLERRVGEQRVEVDAVVRAPGLQRGQVTDRRVEPDIEILSRRVGDLDAEVRRIAGDVPVGELAARHRGAARLVGSRPFAEPLLRLGQHLGLQSRLAVPVALAGPALQELDAAGVRQAEEVVLRRTKLRRGARQRRERVLQVGRRVDGAADLAGVAVLVLRAAFGALALDIAVGQEHALDGIEELLDRAHVDQPLVAQRQIDRLRQFGVLGRVGAVPVVEGDVEAVEVLAPAGGDAGDEFPGRLAGLFGGDHDRRAVGVVGTDEAHVCAPHALEPHPDIGLDVLHDVADVERAVGIRQGGGDEQVARAHRANLSKRRAGARVDAAGFIQIKFSARNRLLGALSCLPAGAPRE